MANPDKTVTQIVDSVVKKLAEQQQRTTTLTATTFQLHYWGAIMNDLPVSADRSSVSFLYPDNMEPVYQALRNRNRNFDNANPVAQRLRTGEDVLALSWLW
jgi:hypothetical protein